MTPFVLGIDGGGTRTRAAAVALDGRVLAVGMGGSSNYDDVGVEIAQQNIDQAVTAATQAAGLERSACAAVFLGMAGVTSATDQEHIRQIALNLRLAPPERIGVDHDCRVALAGGLEGRPGIVQIIGTGSSCYGRNGRGEGWMAGGRGHLLADEGSGYWLGVEAMRAAVRAYDGRGPHTPLLPWVLEALNIHSIEEILHRLHVTGMTRPEIAALGPLVVQAAMAGDPIAVQIVALGAQELAECVLAVAVRLGLDTGPCEVCAVGGMLQAGPIVGEQFGQAVQRLLPLAVIKSPALPPVLGAALLGLEMTGVEAAIQPGNPITALPS